MMRSWSARVITGKQKGVFNSRIVVSRESGPSRLRVPVMRRISGCWHNSQITRSEDRGGQPQLSEGVKVEVRIGPDFPPVVGEPKLNQDVQLSLTVDVRQDARH